MGIITPLSEQLTKPLPHAIVLVNLKELSSGAHKLLPEGAFKINNLRFCPYIYRCTVTQFSVLVIYCFLLVLSNYYLFQAQDWL
jgi:hypothetical protein